MDTGYRRGGTYSTMQGVFSTFSPKAFATIGLTSTTIADRSIPIYMRRRLADEHIERFHPRDARDVLEPLRDRAVGITRHINELERARPTLPDKLNDRQCQIWEPLWAIADLAGGKWPQRSRDLAFVLRRDDDDDSEGVALLTDLLMIRNSRPGTDRMSLQDIAAAHGVLVDPMFRRKLTPRELGRVLRVYKVTPKTLRLGETTAKGVQWSQLHDAWNRYVTD